jgi:hypothetical protein
VDSKKADFKVSRLFKTPLATLACGGVSQNGRFGGGARNGPPARSGSYHLSLVGRRSKPNKLCLEDAQSEPRGSSRLILVEESPKPLKPRLKFRGEPNGRNREATN